MIESVITIINTFSYAESGSDSVVLVSPIAVGESCQRTFYCCGTFTHFHFQKKNRECIVLLW